ncbi:MAG: FAD-dependent monooxygenase [Pseudomonadota bacterium]
MKKVVVAGGGIGGLCSALCFHRFGWDVEVLEQAPALKEVGAGIQISPNGVKVLRAIGLEDTVSANAFVPQSTQIRGGRSGKLIGTVRLGSHIEERHGAPYWHIHRADLIAALEQAIELRQPGAIRTNASVTRYEQTDDAVRAVLAEGDVVQGDLLVGADGIRSIIRQQMLGPSKPRFTGNVAWRAVVPVDRLGQFTPPPTASVWVGEGRHAVTYLLRRGTLANIVGVVERSDWKAEGWMEQGTKQAALNDFAGWHPIVRTILEQADAHYCWALFDREPLNRWGDGRVVLLGDACHPMLPFMAQGAVMAMEDAFVLARELSSASATSGGIAQYYRARRNRTARVQRTARDNAGIFHRRSSLGKLAAYAPLWLASKALPTALDQRYDWIYGHDVTAGSDATAPEESLI